MNVFIEHYKGHNIYLHTTTCVYSCKIVGEMESFFKICRAIDALT